MTPLVALTHYPEANDLFTWLDGALILAYLLVGGGLLATGGTLWLSTLLAARIAKDAPRLATVCTDADTDGSCQRHPRALDADGDASEG